MNHLFDERKSNDAQPRSWIAIGLLTIVAVIAVVAFVAAGGGGGGGVY